MKKTVSDEISAGTFMRMKENMTTISHKNQGAIKRSHYKAMGHTYHTHGRHTSQHK